MIEYYNNIEMPYLRYHRFIKFLSMSSEVGNDANSMTVRRERALKYLANGDTESAKIELSNMRLLDHFIKNDVIPEGLALAITVKSIDGQPCDDISTEGLNKVLAELDKRGLTKAKAQEQNETVKKKSLTNWRFIFQRFFGGKKLSSILLL